MQYSKTRNKAARQMVVRRSLLVFFFLLLAVGLLVGLYQGVAYSGSLFFSRNPKFELKNINITSDGRLTPEFFLQRSGLETGTNLFQVDFEVLMKRFQEVPLVESVTLERRLPDTLNIRIVERVAMAQIRWNPKTLPFLLDRHAVVIPMTRSGQSLPLIEGFRTQILRPGDRLDNPGIRQCLDLQAAVDRSGLGAQITFNTLDIRHPDFVTAQVNGEMTVRFPLHSAEDKLDRLAKTLRQASIQGKRLKTIDLTPDGVNVPVTFYELPVETN
jgi:cell division protein FtsQ